MKRRLLRWLAAKIEPWPMKLRWWAGEMSDREWLDWQCAMDAHNFGPSIDPYDPPELFVCFSCGTPEKPRRAVK